MSYEVAIEKAWEELKEAGAPKDISVEFLGEDYRVDPEAKKVIAFSQNAPAKDFTSILILHYLAKKLKGLPRLTGEWLPFRELAGIEGYAEAFHKRAVEPLIRKYASLSQDKSVTVEAFSGVPVLIKFWAPDAEFSADANIFFDQSVTGIFCTEDIAVLAGIVAAKI